MCYVFYVFLEGVVGATTNGDSLDEFRVSADKRSMREEGGGLVFACAFYLRVYTFLPLSPRIVTCSFWLVGCRSTEF